MRVGDAPCLDEASVTGPACLSEARTGTHVSDLVREVLRTFSGDDTPDISDTFNRARSIEAIVSPSHLVRGLVAALRKPGETGYKIPRGWLYEKISCPNYFGEFLIWTGWAIATWSSAGVVFVLWTLANLLPRALSTHQWYRQKFADYPAQRRAVIPGIL